MHEQLPRPVLLFAFATEDVTIQVEEEARAIQSALRDVSGKLGLCDVEIPPFLKLQDIADVFQKNRSRVSVFHYAGHANGSELLLRTALGTGAGATGLTTLVRGQAGLKLVFLNGCSTERQVDLWIAAGVPCVIATTQAIHGEVAKNFASRFYAGLATGASIHTAYEEAVGEATAACKGNTRLLFADEDPEVAAESSHGRWPWFMRMAAGAEAVGDWNLPDAAGDPLALLPVKVDGPLPESPYPGLRRFTAADAQVFFGRGKEIRRLYELVTSSTAAPILLLHGQSGVGKSSILEAGLTPRLQVSYNGSASCEVITVRLDPARGVLDSLRMVFVEDAVADDGSVVPSSEAWRRKESRIGKPLLVILDQLEEAFTHAKGPVPSDWHLFVAELASIFGDRSLAPRGKLVLSFRTEWFSRVNSRLEGLWKSDVFLDCLDAAGIEEAIEGPTRHRQLRNHYPLTIEPGVAERISTELLMDSETSVAPTLQILLKKLWDQATRESRKPTFTESLYRRHRSTLGDFVRTQVHNIASQKSLSAAAKKAVDAGLLLDFLECHVTPELTSRHQLQKTLLCGDPQASPPVPPRYPGREQVIGELRQLCINHYLLIQPDSGTNADPEPGSRLAHDSLAVHVHTIYQASDAAGPRARRILEQRAIEKTQGVHDELDGTSLNAIEQGEFGMRALTAEEKEIVRVGRRSRLLRRGLIVSGILIVMATIGVFRWAQYNAELESVFRDPPEQVSEGLAIASRHPWISQSRALSVFQEFESEEKKGSRESLRAAMILVELGSPESKHRKRIVDEIRHFNSTEDLSEFLAVKRVLLDDLEESADRWSEWLQVLPSRVQDIGEPAVVTALLLSAGHPEILPKEWYEPSPDQEDRTTIILELTQWLPLQEIDRLTMEMPLEDEDSRSHLQAVLCLAIAESSDALQAVSSNDQSLGENTSLRVLEQSPSATLHGAAKLLLDRMGREKEPGSQDIQDSTQSDQAFSVSYSDQKAAKAQWATVRFGTIEMDFVRIPEGTTAEGRKIDEAFWMSATEVPAALFARFQKAQPSRWKVVANRPRPNPNKPQSMDDVVRVSVRRDAPSVQVALDDPATCISWSEAVYFCNWCSDISKLAPCYECSEAQPLRPEEFSLLETGTGFRLPTSDEWGYACAAGSTTAYHFGSKDQNDRQEILGRFAWFAENSWSPQNRRIRVVRRCGTRLPNAWGLHDMLGNVLEWCWTPLSDKTDPPVREGMLRSGSVDSQRHECVTSDTTALNADQLKENDNNPGFGIRLVIDKLPP